MTLVHRVLYPTPIASIEEYLEGAGRPRPRCRPRALRRGDHRRARGLGAAGAGRRRVSRPGGSGAPSATTAPTSSARRSWSTRAEGEPGTFKDRTIMLNDPYQVLEGALIAAHRRRRRPDHRRDQALVRAPRSQRLRSAIDEIKARGLGRRDRDRRLRRPERVPLRRGDCAARDDRRPVSRSRGSRRRTGAACARSWRRPPTCDTRAAGCPRTSRWPAPTPTTTRRPRSSTTSRRWPTSRGILARGAEWFRTEGTDRVAGNDRVHGHRFDGAQRCRRGRSWARRCARSSR